MILCCGEALIDMIPAATQADRNGFVPYSGGSVFNTAIALGRLGVPTGFLTGLSTDMFGEQLAHDLSHSQVDTRLAIRSDLPTTLAFVTLKDGQASYAFYDENTAGRSLRPDQLPDVPNEVTALYFGGISLISEPCAEFYAALAEREASRRAIMLDPNIREGFISDEARYRARLSRLISVADIVKVSDEDLHWIISGATSKAEKVADLLAHGPKVVILTEGAAGASAWCAGKAPALVQARPVDVVDTVGAGDTFNAGVLAQLHSSGLLTQDALSSVVPGQLVPALDKGTAVATVTVARAGANPPWAAELADVAEIL